MKRLRRVYTHPTVRGHIDCCGNMADGLSDGHGDGSDGDQSDGSRHLGDNLGIKDIHLYQQKTSMTQ